MPRQPQDTTPLAALPPDERTRALERYRIIQPCVEHDIPLTHVARQHAMPLRTVERWLAQYRRYGLVGLSRRRRRDQGHPCRGSLLICDSISRTMQGPGILPAQSR